MPNTKQRPRPLSDQATDGSTRERSTDHPSTNAYQSQSRVTRPKSSLLGRISNFLTSTPKKHDTKIKAAPERTWKAFQTTNVGLHLTQDPHPETNITHRKLPEEHRAAHEEARKMALVQQHHFNEPPRELRGPVPRNRLDSNGRMAPDAIQHISEFRLNMDLNFLAPVERDVLHLMRRTRRSSHFRPLLNPSEEILLVHADDTAAIRQIQDAIRPLPEKEKYTLAGDLHKFLSAEKNYMLKLLLFSPKIRVTTNARGQGLGMEEAERPEERPKNAVGFKDSVGSLGSNIRSGSRKSEDTATQASSKINRTQTFEITVEPRPSLRGGGGEDDKRVRSLSSYTSVVRGSKLDRLKDEDRVPKAIWWLAGGRGSSKNKQPTAGELRERRRAEDENQVGFWRTYFGRKAAKAKSVRTEVEEYKPADDGQGTTTPPVDGELDDAVASGALPAPEHHEPLPPRPASSASVNSHAGSQNLDGADGSKSPARSIMSSTSNREQPSAPPVTEGGHPADDGANRETEPPSEAAVEQGK